MHTITTRVLALALLLSTPVLVWAAPETEKDRRDVRDICLAMPQSCPKGMERTTMTDLRANGAAATFKAQKAEAAARAEQAAYHIMHSTCAELRPEARAIWEKQQAGTMLTYEDNMLWSAWAAVCQTPTPLGPRP
jgi:hypothetical protein